MSLRVFETVLVLVLYGLTLSSCGAPIWVPPESRLPPPQGAEEASRTPAPLSPRVLAS